jgi:hypothetical protein
MLLRRDAGYVTSAILPIRNVNLTLLPIDRIVLILKAELFLRTTAIDGRFEPRRSRLRQYAARFRASDHVDRGRDFPVAGKPLRVVAVT